MGLGEQNQASEQALDEGLINPIKPKDPEISVATYTEGTRQKLRSSKVPLLLCIAEAVIVLILIIVIAVLSHRAPCVTEKIASARCKDGWIMYRNKCYYINEKPDTWTTSQKFCKDNNLSLAIIHNKEEYEFLNRIKDRENYWIGLGRTENNSGWIWADGTTYSEDLFPIHRLPISDGGLERVYLNHQGVKSGSETVEKRSFCSTELLSQSS